LEIEILIRNSKLLLRNLFGLRKIYLERVDITERVWKENYGENVNQEFILDLQKEFVLRDSNGFTVALYQTSRSRFYFLFYSSL